MRADIHPEYMDKMCWRRVQPNRIYELKSVQNAILFLQANKNLWILLAESNVFAKSMKNLRMGLLKQGAFAGVSNPIEYINV